MGHTRSINREIFTDQMVEFKLLDSFPCAVSEILLLIRDISMVQRRTILININGLGLIELKQTKIQKPADSNCLHPCVCLLKLTDY